MQNNPITEVAILVVAGLLIIAGAVLLYLGTIDFTGATLIFGLALGLLGYNTALKVPSPIQQAQQNAQQQNVQQLLSQALAVLPVFAGLLHSHGPTPQVTMSAHPVQTPQAPVAPPQAQQTAAPMQSVMLPEVMLTPSLPHSGTINMGLSTVTNPTGTATTSTLTPQPPVALPQRDAWSNSALMQAIQRPPQQ